MSGRAGDNWLEECLAAIGRAKVAVFGDFCLDCYWLIDAALAERSVETHLPIWRVRQQRYSLGGAGNVAANLVDLGVEQVLAVGLVGDDLFGGQLMKLLDRRGVDTKGMLRCQSDWQTLVYAKPCIGSDEQNRIDFGGFNRVAEGTMDQLTEQLSNAAEQADVVILNQQVPAGISPPAMVTRINAVVAQHGGGRFIVDSRDHAELYEGAILKLNAHEAAGMLGESRPLDEPIGAAAAAGLGQRLADEVGRLVFVTRGGDGMVAAEPGKAHQVPGIEIIEQTDTVGAGDTAAAALAACLAGGVSAANAAALANIAASVTVRKLQTTGTAAPDEIRSVGPDPDYVYLPDLAADTRAANYISASEIELVRKLPDDINIRHAIFDHDGTISTLRQGWEELMEPMMVRAVLGDQFDSADAAVYGEIVEQVRAFIDKTTGVQTLVQMQGLVEMVKRFGRVPAEQMLDMHGYKAVYNETLLAMVGQRAAKLASGELAVSNFTIKGALPFVRHLYDHGVKLYLASGTDDHDVKAEAAAMGYADLFEGRIFGSVGDINVEAKRVVMDRIIEEHALRGPELVTFGDGPVEIRETRKRGGIAVGIASDEARRFGLNTAKRARLIRGGADLIAPDFSQVHVLLDVLNLPRLDQ